MSFPWTSANHRSSAAIGGGTGFLIREPFTQLPSSLPNFSSFEVSSLALKLPQSKVSFFNIYRPPSSSSFSKPFSCFLDEFTFFLPTAATTPQEFIITGDFNLHLDNLDNPSDHLTSQFLSVLSSFNLTQHVDFCRARKYDHVTHLLRDLHWLWVSERIQFCLAVLAFCCCMDKAPSYLADELHWTDEAESRHRLRSGSCPRLIIREPD